MIMNTRRALSAAVLIAAAIGTTGCGSSSGSGTPSNGGVASASVTINASGPSATVSAGADTNTAKTRAVTIQNFAFAPKILTVPVGTTVTWTNRDTVTHTVTATNNAFNSHDLQTGKSFSFTFAKAGTYNYMCQIHPYMTAQVIVQ
ncbi:MAG: cupredoxin domain-containing protein [Frankia sp.]